MGDLDHPIPQPLDLPQTGGYHDRFHCSYFKHTRRRCLAVSPLCSFISATYLCLVYRQTDEQTEMIIDQRGFSFISLDVVA